MTTAVNKAFQEFMERFKNLESLKPMLAVLSNLTLEKEFEEAFVAELRLIVETRIRVYHAMLPHRQRGFVVANEGLSVLPCVILVQIFKNFTFAEIIVIKQTSKKLLGLLKLTMCAHFF